MSTFDYLKQHMNLPGRIQIFLKIKEDRLNLTKTAGNATKATTNTHAIESLKQPVKN
jgi:hypothetical protein